jgi:hypothetical protein
MSHNSRARSVPAFRMNIMQTTETGDRSCSVFPSHAGIIKSACLDFLGFQPDSRRDSPDPVVDFALSLHAKAPLNELLARYRRIANPGTGMALAALRYCVAQKDMQAASGIFDDMDPDSLRPRDRVSYAEILAERGDFDAALDQIARAYSEDETLKDAHARIAWKIFWPKKEYDKVIEWMERDSGQRTGDGGRKAEDGGQRAEDGG